MAKKKEKPEEMLDDHGPAIIGGREGEIIVPDEEGKEEKISPKFAKEKRKKKSA